MDCEIIQMRNVQTNHYIFLLFHQINFPNMESEISDIVPNIIPISSDFLHIPHIPQGT